MSRPQRVRCLAQVARRVTIAALAAWAFLMTGEAAAAGAGETDTRVEVTVMAPEGLRLADELKRELEISGFAVTAVATPAPGGGREVKPDWRARVYALAAAQTGRTVAVRADEREIILVSPRAARAPGLQTTFELQLAPEERSSRRRACLTVVEYLRVLAESDDRAEGKQAAETTPPPAAPQATLEKSTSAADPRPEERSSLFPGLPWTMGVATTLDLSSAGGRPGGHLQFLWYFPFGARVSLRARVGWPILGADFDRVDAEVRMWTFGAGVGLQYAFRSPGARVRPFAGLALGNRIALSDTTFRFTAQTRTAITPSAILGLEAGVRIAIRPRVQVLGELEVTRGWLGPTSSDTGPAEELASAMAAHASLGVLFEY